MTCFQKRKVEFYDNYSVIGESKIETNFQLIIWETNDKITEDYLQGLTELSLIELKKRYKILFTITDQNIVKYYWDEQVMTMISNKNSYKMLFNQSWRIRTEDFFTMVINNKILNYGVVWKGYTRFDCPVIFLPLVQEDSDSYGENIGLLQFAPFYPLSEETKMWHISDFKEEDKKRIMLPELYEYFNAQGKIVRGEFPFKSAEVKEPVD